MSGDFPVALSGRPTGGPERAGGHARGRGASHQTSTPPTSQTSWPLPAPRGRRDY